MKIFFFFFFEFGKLEFFKGIENFGFFFFFWKKFGNPEFFWRNWKFWLMIFFFLEQPKKYKPNAPSPKAFFENFLFFFLERFRKDWFFFFFLKYEDLFIIKKWRRWRWSKSDEDLFMMMFFEKPILWMRTTLVGSWCRLLDKSLLNSCKKIISISNGFIHWNELEVFTQCP